MQIGDYTAHVLVDDNELEEHHVELEEPHRLTCWIASEAGKVCHDGTPLASASPSSSHVPPSTDV
jgi:hypothetical protein